MSLIIAAVLSLAGCAAATEAPNEPAPAAIDGPAAPAPTSPEQSPSPAPSEVQDTPGPECASARFVSTADAVDGPTVKDTTTGLVWLATDFPYETGQFPSATAACAFDGHGYRAATSAEVIALTAAVPSCHVPLAFQAIYAWAPNATVLPITTSDGCVDMSTGATFAGACHLPDVADGFADTLCVK